MKNKTPFSLLQIAVIVLSIFCYACSKSSTPAPGPPSPPPPPPPPPKDYAALFKNTVWTGEFAQNAGDLPLPYNMVFIGGDSVHFYVSFDGINRGTYTLEDKKLTCSFYNIKITGTVTAADTLTQIKAEYPQGWVVHSAKLNTLTAQQLDNTTWIGKNPYNAYQDTVVLEFKPGSMVGVNKIHNLPYTRNAGRIYFALTGVGPYFDYRFYFFQMPDGTLKGLRDSQARYFYFLAKKQ